MSSSIPGDPAGMQAKARRLRVYAEQIQALADQIDKKVGGMEFEGRAANRLRDTMHTWNTDVMRAAIELRELEQLLLRSAGDVEARQAAEARRPRETQSGGGGW